MLWSILQLFALVLLFMGISGDALYILNIKDQKQGSQTYLKISTTFQLYFKTKIPNFSDNSERHETNKKDIQYGRLHIWPPYTLYVRYWAGFFFLTKGKRFLTWFVEEFISE